MADVPRITLTGDALRGIDEEISPPRVRGVGAEGVALGAIVRPQTGAVPMLGQFLQPAPRSLPPKTTWRTKAKKSLARMLCNDAYGCCVISGKGHKLAVNSGNDGPVERCPTDEEILRDYNRLKAGPGDSGCYIGHVLDAWRDEGLLCQGERSRIDGYVAVNLGNQELAKASVNMLGGLTIGVRLPRDWTSEAIWDITNSPVVGGHDVELVDYDGDGLYVSSWGRIYLLTWRAYLDRRWVTEAYVALSPDWYNQDHLSPGGLDVSKMKRAIEDIGGGRVPTEDDPPTPPEPGGGVLAIELTGTLDTVFGPIPITLTGTATEGGATARLAPRRDSDAAGAMPDWMDSALEVLERFLQMLKAKRTEDNARRAAEGDDDNADERGRSRQVAGQDRPADAGEHGADRRSGHGVAGGDRPAVPAGDDSDAGGSDGGAAGVVRPRPRGERPRPESKPAVDVPPDTRTEERKRGRGGKSG